VLPRLTPCRLKSKKGVEHLNSPCRLKNYVSQINSYKDFHASIGTSRAALIRLSNAAEHGTIIGTLEAWI
jgi:hypothetical protein